MTRSRLKPSPMKRKKALNKVSAKKRRWMDQYVVQKIRGAEWQKCPHCVGYAHKSMMEPHHPFGRVKERLLIYVWICKGLHQWIHDNGKVARELGWIQPQFDGRKADPSLPRPWEKQDV